MQRASGHGPAASRAKALFLSAVFAGACASASAGEVALSVDGGYFDMTNARNSAKAIFGSVPGGATFGASIRFALGKSFFVAAGGRFFQREGQRAFVADKDSPPFRLGHPLTLQIIPVYGLLGYRFSPDSRLVPYVAIGPGITSYRETSVIGDLEVEPLTETKASGHLVAGIEYGRGGVRLGLEAMYSTVPSSIGVAGVSKVYGESDVGGLTLVARIAFAL